MSNSWLYERLSDRLEEEGDIALLPSELENHLSQSLRDYQHTALRCLQHVISHPDVYPEREFLFHMATGSGKTLVMAGSILYFYLQGYRRFLFCSNREVIVAKTRDNLFNIASSKYLFKQNIQIHGRPVQLREVSAFSQSSGMQDIEIMLTTVQKLHTDLRNPKENGLSEDALADENMIILADEAHHLQVESTKKAKNEKDNWEWTIRKLLGAHVANYLLEFTATMDMKNDEISTKYKSKTLANYTLREFREDEYSKEIYCASGADIKLRILQTLLLSEYRRIQFSKHGVDMKPIVLFKSAAIKKTQQSMQLPTAEDKCYYAEEAYQYFISDFFTTLKAADFHDLETFWERSSDAQAAPIFLKALKFLNQQYTSQAALIESIKKEFSEAHCRIVHSQLKNKEKINTDLNQLEDKDNPIRAIFAVDMLNEGWDVLNLFDIVRLYETKNPAKSSVQEAQLIGRGARYFPFSCEERPGEDKYKRKFEDDPNHPLHVCESLYYHCEENRAFIDELNKQLEAFGLKPKRELREIKLKESFMKSALYRSGKVVLNKQTDCRRDIPAALTKEQYTYSLGQKKGLVERMQGGGQTSHKILPSITVKGKDLGYEVLRTAIQCTNGLTYAYIQNKYRAPTFPSLRDYIGTFLFTQSIKVTGRDKPESISQEEKLSIAKYLIERVKKVIDTKSRQKKGTTFSIEKPIHTVFKQKTFLTTSGNEVPCTEEYFAYHTLYLTSEERDFLGFMKGKIDSLKQNYQQIYLLRNEHFFKIYKFEDGQAFEPDFVLFARKQKSDKPLLVQCFIEPKGTQRSSVSSTSSASFTAISSNTTERD